ncbi:MAG: hypothetical protein AABX70_06600 [Nanoarchaeota archaeon]
MVYLTIHGKQIPCPDGEIGLYRDEELGRMPLGYGVSAPCDIERVANDMPEERALAGARGMLERATRQLAYEHADRLPVQFRTGLANSKQFYGEIVRALEGK